MTLSRADRYVLTRLMEGDVHSDTLTGGGQATGADLAALLTRGLIAVRRSEDSPHRWTLTPLGQRALSDAGKPPMDLDTARAVIAPHALIAAADAVISQTMDPTEASYARAIRARAMAWVEAQTHGALT